MSTRDLYAPPMWLPPNNAGAEKARAPCCDLFYTISKLLYALKTSIFLPGSVHVRVFESESLSLGSRRVARTQSCQRRRGPVQYGQRTRHELAMQNWATQRVPPHLATWPHTPFSALPDPSVRRATATSKVATTSTPPPIHNYQSRYSKRTPLTVPFISPIHIDRMNALIRTQAPAQKTMYGKCSFVSTSTSLINFDFASVVANSTVLTATSLLRNLKNARTSTTSPRPLLCVQMSTRAEECAMGTWHGTKRGST